MLIVMIEPFTNEQIEIDLPFDLADHALTDDDWWQWQPPLEVLNADADVGPTSYE